MIYEMFKEESTTIDNIKPIHYNKNMTINSVAVQIMAETAYNDVMVGNYISKELSIVTEGVVIEKVKKVFEAIKKFIETLISKIKGLIELIKRKHNERKYDRIVKRTDRAYKLYQKLEKKLGFDEELDDWEDDWDKDLYFIDDIEESYINEATKGDTELTYYEPIDLNEMKKSLNTTMRVQNKIYEQLKEYQKLSSSDERKKLAKKIDNNVNKDFISESDYKECMDELNKNAESLSDMMKKQMEKKIKLKDVGSKLNELYRIIEIARKDDMAKILFDCYKELNNLNKNVEYLGKKITSSFNDNTDPVEIAIINKAISNVQRMTSLSAQNFNKLAVMSTTNQEKAINSCIKVLNQYSNFVISICNKAKKTEM